MDMVAKEDVIVIGYEMEIDKQDTLYCMEFQERREMSVQMSVC